MCNDMLDDFLDFCYEEFMSVKTVDDLGFFGDKFYAPECKPLFPEGD